MSKILDQLAAVDDAVVAEQAEQAEAWGDGAPPPGNLDALTARVLELKPVAAQHVAELGSLLTQVKTVLGHGSFVAWLGDVAAMTRSTATKYMRAAEMPNIQTLEPLGVEKLYILRTLDNVASLTPHSTLPVPPDQQEKTLHEMSTRELRAAVHALTPGRPARRAMRRDLVQRYIHLRAELAQVVHQLNNGDPAARARFQRLTGQTPEQAAEVLPHLP